MRYLQVPGAYPPVFLIRGEFADPARLSQRMKRDVSGLLFDHLEFFQALDEIKPYYDNGRDIARRALGQSFGFVLSKGGAERRKTSMTDYRLEQVADYLCATGLAGGEVRRPRGRRDAQQVLRRRSGGMQR